MRKMLGFALAVALGVLGAESLAPLLAGLTVTPQAVAESPPLRAQIFDPIGGGFIAARTCQIFKFSQIAGSTGVVWTPASGKKWRLMRYEIQVSWNAASGTVNNPVDLCDGAGGACTTVVQRLSAVFPAAAATTLGPGISSGWIDLGNGILSAAANNTLSMTMDIAALTAGLVSTSVCGTEE